ITLYDRNRAEVTLGSLIHTGGDATKVSAGINKTLAPGTYTVVWRVISGIDGHVTAGTFAFRLRDPSKKGTPEAEGPVVPLGPVGASPLEGKSDSADPLRWAIRAIILAAAALLTGGPLFTVLVIEPTLLEKGDSGARLWRVLAGRFA